MKRWCFIILSLFNFYIAGINMTASAQTGAMTMKFGFLSYEEVMKAMPEYATMQKNLTELRAQYEAEQQRVEDDFNRKYEEFLDGQASYPKTILQKRQSELQEMLEKNIAFKQESQQLLSNAEATMLDGLKSTITTTLVMLGQERGYAFILNTDQNAVPFINPALGEDITTDVISTLNANR